MTNERARKFAENAIEMALLASIGKALVKKGLLSTGDIISELLDVRRIVAESDQTEQVRLFCIGIDDVVRNVQRW